MSAYMDQTPAPAQFKFIQTVDDHGEIFKVMRGDIAVHVCRDGIFAATLCDCLNRYTPTPAAPEPPVPVDLDLEAILAMSQRRPVQYQDLGLLMESVPALVAEVRALRSRLSEVEGAAPMLREAMDLLENWPLPKMGNPLREELAADRTLLRKRFKALPTEGTAKPSQDPKPSHTDAGQEDALQSLGNLLDFIDLKKDEMLELCENPGRLEECIDAARSLIEPQHSGEAK